MMKLTNIFFSIILLVGLVSCGTVKRFAPPVLLPEPQHITTTAQIHRLHNGAINPNSVRERLVQHIEGVENNPNEAYRLVITPSEVLIEAITEQGLFWAKQTLQQMVDAAPKGKYIPCVEIVDYPSFRIRGFLHDTGRSYMSVDEIKKHIRLLSSFKINTFHWHLTENQGWRLESKVYPQLNDSIHFERHHGQYYTIAEAQEIADYCKAHHVLLIPEIDMPGHSAAFVRAMGVDMQSEEGMAILKKLLTEICTEVFPDVPYIHLGTDEVQFTNPRFVPEMVAFTRGLGKKVISWNPGWNYQVGEIDMTQLWSYRGKAQPGIPAIDCRLHYINHYDAFGDIVGLYNSRIGDVEKGSFDMAGSILAVWNDRSLPSDRDIVAQNNFYPAMLALAERTWRGGGTEYFDDFGTIIPTDTTHANYKAFADFERRMLWHKQQTFANEPFYYVKQTDMRWRITDAFPNGGDLSKSFPPEEGLSASYAFEGKTYATRDAIGAGFYLRHVWGNTVATFYDKPHENHTAYAYTYVYSPVQQTVGLWVSTQDYSRSESDLSAPQGEWDWRKSKVFINDTELTPPVWENTHTNRTNEITLKNENFQGRAPLSVSLQKGWNKVLIKLPVGHFSSPQVRLQKWGFTFVFVNPDGTDRVEGLIYNPDKKLN